MRLRVRSSSFVVSAKKTTKKAKPHGKKAPQFGTGNAGTFGAVYPSDVLNLASWSLQVGLGAAPHAWLID